MVYARVKMTLTQTLIRSEKKEKRNRNGWLLLLNPFEVKTVQMQVPFTSSSSPFCWFTKDAFRGNQTTTLLSLSRFCLFLLALIVIKLYLDAEHELELWLVCWEEEKR